MSWCSRGSLRLWVPNSSASVERQSFGLHRWCIPVIPEQIESGGITFPVIFPPVLRGRQVWTPTGQRKLILTTPKDRVWGNLSSSPAPNQLYKPPLGFHRNGRTKQQRSHLPLGASPWEIMSSVSSAGASLRGPWVPKTGAASHSPELGSTAPVQLSRRLFGHCLEPGKDLFVTISPNSSMHLMHKAQQSSLFSNPRLLTVRREVWCCRMESRTRTVLGSVPKHKSNF